MKSLNYSDLSFTMMDRYILVFGFVLTSRGQENTNVRIFDKNTLNLLATHTHTHTHPIERNYPVIYHKIQ